jgi:hypothetical protein
MFAWHFQRFLRFNEWLGFHLAHVAFILIWIVLTVKRICSLLFKLLHVICKVNILFELECSTIKLINCAKDLFWSCREHLLNFGALSLFSAISLSQVWLFIPFRFDWLSWLLLVLIIHADLLEIILSSTTAFNVTDVLKHE